MTDRFEIHRATLQSSYPSEFEKNGHGTPKRFLISQEPEYCLSIPLYNPHWNHESQNVPKTRPIDVPICGGGVGSQRVCACLPAELQAFPATGVLCCCFFFPSLRPSFLSCRRLAEQAIQPLPAHESLNGILLHKKPRKEARQSDISSPKTFPF